MDGSVEITEYIFRIGAAFLLGGIIGFERQWQQKDAGLRTNTLVAIGAASYVLLSLDLHSLSGGDPGRVTAQIVTGIGFIGAGVIMKDGFGVRGLNTAATIWCSAAVGTLAGMGFFAGAIVTTTAVVLSHLILRPISVRLSKLSAYRKTKVKETYYQVSIQCSLNIESNVRFWVLSHIETNDQLLLRSINRDIIETNPEEIIIQVEVATIGNQENLLENLVTSLIMKLEVTRAGWKLVGQETEF
ncbi:MgtC/SapB family protein [Gelidibacter japonicus]|jgi:putative Mg2+ transporter-C (MgtC) family protein|uniref:MgtC/SapB family protein n=1 Tax=Gelidibacter japonicus TaxID=1962232 RepID=UPI0020228CFE|nr:MgtC/SapB family protein [Gelidibacter japonicus]MCL8009116.1 MgtC/SapB family protein [Gelidibacter japonicus]